MRAHYGPPLRDDLDAYGYINELDRPIVDSLISCLEFRGRDAIFSQFRRAYLDKVSLPASAGILELGCGTGVVTRALAAREGFARACWGSPRAPRSLSQLTVGRTRKECASASTLELAMRPTIFFRTWNSMPLSLTPC